MERSEIKGGKYVPIPREDRERLGITGRYYFPTFSGRMRTRFVLRTTGEVVREDTKRYFINGRMIEDIDTRETLIGTDGRLKRKVQINIGSMRVCHVLTFARVSPVILNS